MSDHPVERRKNKRISVTLPIRLYTKDKKMIPADMEDISLGGAFIRCAIPINVGDEISMEINFSGIKAVAGKVFSVESLNVETPEKATETAIIRWSKSSSTFGVEFVNPNKETQRFIQRLVDYFKRL